MKKSHFVDVGYLFANVNYYFGGKNLEKRILRWHFLLFFCWLKLPFCRHKLRKACFTSQSSCQGKKSDLQGLGSYIAETFVGDELTLTTTNINLSSANPTKWSNTINSSATADKLFECV